VTTYCINSDLVLDSGESIADDFLAETLSDDEITTRLDTARERAYRQINGRHLKDFTLTPASLSVIPDLKFIEIDLVLSAVLGGGFAAGTKRKLPTKFYYDRAMEALKNLQYPATASTPVAGSGNTGNGTISAITVNDEYAITETWTLIALNNLWFRVEGTRTKDLPDCEVDVSYPDITAVGLWGTDYGLKKQVPVKEYTDYPISFKITSGTVDFAQYDTFTFKTWSATRQKPRATMVQMA